MVKLQNLVLECFAHMQHICLFRSIDSSQSLEIRFSIFLSADGCFLDRLLMVIAIRNSIECFWHHEN
jgi:hypothetical protein